MTDKIRKALELIEIPAGLDKDAEKGVRRAVIEEKRSRIAMKKTAIIAAAFALVIAASAAIGGGLTIAKKPGKVAENDGGPATAEEVKTVTEKDGYMFMGIDAVSKKAAVGVVGKSGGIGDIIEFADYKILDDSENEVGGSESFLMQSSWYDGEGVLHVSDVILSGKLVADGDGKHYELAIDPDALNGLTFSLKTNYGVAEENGVAVAEAGENDIALSFAEAGGGRKNLNIDVLSEKAPFSEIAEIIPIGYRVFDENGTAVGAEYNFTDGESEINASETWRLKRDGKAMYVEDSDGDGGQRCFVYICAFRAKLNDGSELEIHGDWIVDFTV